jgi:formylglycine-generating enzyme required for sulfatase activity
MYFVAGCYSSQNGNNHDADVQEDADAIDITFDDFEVVDSFTDETESHCGDRECGIDPVSGIDCGDCSIGFDCNVEGRCIWRCQESTCVTTRIPEGWFIRGDEEVWAAPRQEVWLSEYHIDVYEVTIERYRACMEADICEEPPLYWEPYPEALWDPSYSLFPIAWVTHEQAQVYCDWIGGRLPSEAQWEKAARGGCPSRSPESCGVEDTVEYPWGNDSPTCGLANLNYGDGETDVCCIDGCSPWEVGSEPGASIYGVFDMIGNLSEYINDWYSASAYEECGEPCLDPLGPTSGDYIVLRGSDFLSDDVPTWPLYWRFYTLPDMGTDRSGFRCAYNFDL